MSLEVMMPENPRWEKFANALYQLMEWDENGWKCDGDEIQNPEHLELVHRRAKAVMALMGGIDIEKSLSFFKEHGGYCDCEILLNVDPN
jgi:hypothetical protein